MSAPIENYAIIGDLRTAALVSRAGSMDWLCLPDFDSGACFAALLGDEGNGHWAIAPAIPIQASSRTYRPDSLILETELATALGTIRITDFMRTRDNLAEFMPPEHMVADSIRVADADPAIIRIVEGLEGEVPLRSELRLRFDYGRRKPYICRTDGGLHAVAGPDAVLICNPVPATVHDHAVYCDLGVRRGDRHVFQMLWHKSWHRPPKPCNADDELAVCTTNWRRWSELCRYDGPYRDAVVRSLITLKSLTFAPTGGICAAATTSLPERLGGGRNWDYRYCWMRDSALTLEALHRSGYHDEALQFRDWLVRAVGGAPEQMQIMYGIRGECGLAEMTIDWLSGYEGSRPVRIGNDAVRQFQLDIYGELINVAHYGRAAGIPATEQVWGMQQVVAGFVERAWHLPDDGIWEVRGGHRHFVHSKAMAWVAMDRTARAITEHGLKGDAERWRKVADEIKADVLANGVDPDRNCFVQHYGSKELDASLLMIPRVGFLPPDDPRIVNTIRAIEEDLTVNGLVRRYRTETAADGLSGGEGSFVVCTFWLVECLALIGETDRAKMLFDRMLDLRNDVGLLSEEYDSVNRRMLGNMPQALSHVGLINAAFALQNTGLALDPWA